jgi:hypothetical protein
MTLDDITIAAAAIANARGNRRGVPTITNILDVLPQKLRDEVMDDAMAVARALRSGWQPIETAPTDGTIIDVWLGDASPADLAFYCAQDKRSADWRWMDGKFRPVGGLGGPVSVVPTHWMPLPEPPP